MKPADRWREALALLSAGAQMVPFGDNGSTYRRLAAQLECLRSTGRPAHRPCEPPAAAARWEELR